MDVRQHAEGGDGLAAVARVLRMTVDIFEAVDVAVARRHQLDDAFGAVRGNARRLVECRPAAEVGLDIAGELAQDFGVSSIPTLIVLKDGAEVKRFVGVTPIAELRKAIDAAIG